MDPHNTDRVVSLLNENVSDEDRKGFEYILGELVFIYSFVASQEPRKTYCLAEFGERAEGLQIFLARNFPGLTLVHTFTLPVHTLWKSLRVKKA